MNVSLPWVRSPRYGVSVDAAGNFVIAWESRGQNGDVSIFGRRYDAAGAPRGDEFQMNTPTAFPQAYLGLASHPEGGFVVAWTSVAPPQVAIVGRRYDAAGQPRGDQFQINTTVNLHLLPSLAAGQRVRGGVAASSDRRRKVARRCPDAP